MKAIYFWILVVLIFLNVLVWTFATAADHNRVGCTKNHYFWCDDGWECCAAGSPNCAASKGTGTKDATSYKLTDRVYGTDSYYYKGCIAPFNALNAALKPDEDISNYSLDCIYCTTTGSSSTNYQIIDNEGKTQPCPTCFVPNGFNFNSITCTTTGGCDKSSDLQGYCSYLPFDDIPTNQNHLSSAAPAFMPFYAGQTSGNPSAGFSQGNSGKYFAPGNASGYGDAGKWNYTPSGGPTLSTSQFSALNRMNPYWANTSGPTNANIGQTFIKPALAPVP